MEVKEAIEWIEYHCKKFEPSYMVDLNNSDFDNRKKEVISLLQQGEKYRQMWEELKELIEKNDFLYTYDVLLKNMKNKLEQKYFPEYEEDDNELDREEIEEEEKRLEEEFIRQKYFPKEAKHANNNQ